jgi:hypothetical protein
MTDAAAADAVMSDATDVTPPTPSDDTPMLHYDDDDDDNDWTNDVHPFDADDVESDTARDWRLLRERVASRLTGDAFVSNQSDPMADEAWTHGINRSLYADIQQHRYPLYPQVHRDLCTRGGGQFPIDVPRHCIVLAHSRPTNVPSTAAATPFHRLPFRAKAHQRQRIRSTPANPLADEDAVRASGVPNGFAWNLLAVGVELRRIGDGVVLDRLLLLGGHLNPHLDLANWAHAIDGYTSFLSYMWPATAGTTTATSDATMWLRYCQSVMRSDIAIGSVPGRVALFASPFHNSLGHFAELVEIFVTAQRVSSPEQKKLFAVVFLGSMYMVCIQFWMFCRDRFMVRTDVRRTDEPEYIMITNIEADLPDSTARKAETTRRDQPTAADITSGPYLVHFARTRSLSALVDLVLNSNATDELRRVLKDQELARTLIHDFIHSHVHTNRPKSFESRGFLVHQSPQLNDYINSKHAVVSSSAATSADVVCIRVKQHPSADKGSLNILESKAQPAHKQAFSHCLPRFMSHCLMTPTAPLYSLDGSFTNADFVVNQESREIRWGIAQHDGRTTRDGVNLSNPRPRSQPVFDNTLVWMDRTSEKLDAEVKLRATTTRSAMCIMQFLPFLTKTHVDAFDCVLHEFYSKCTSVLSIRHVVGGQTFDPTRGWDGPATFALRELPSTHNGRRVQLATLPRSYDPRIPHTTHRYACYIVWNGGSVPPRIYRYINEYETIGGPFQINHGDHHVLAMSQMQWLACVGAINNSTCAGLLARVTASVNGSVGKRFIPCICVDAWIERDRPLDKRDERSLYALFVFLSHHVRTEIELIACLVGIYYGAAKLTIIARDKADALRVFRSLQHSAVRYFSRTVDDVFTNPCIRPMQLPVLVREWTNDHTAPVRLNRSVVTYVVDIRASDHDMNPAPHMLYQVNIWDVHAGDSVVDGTTALSRVFQVVNALCTNPSADEFEGKELPDADWQFTVTRCMRMSKLFQSSVSFRCMVNSIVGSEWANNAPIHIGLDQLIALMVLWFNSQALDSASVFMDFQLPVSLVDGDTHWSHLAHPVDPINNLAAHHDALDRQVLEVAQSIESVNRMLNVQTNIPDSVLLGWANKQRAYLTCLNEWVISRQRDDSSARAVKTLYARAMTILARANPVHPVATALASTTPAGNDRLIHDFISALVLQFVNHHGNEDTRRTLLVTSEFFQSLVCGLAIATHESRPHELKKLLREIICKVYHQHPMLSAAFARHARDCAQSEIRAMFAEPPSSYNPSTLFASSSRAIVHPPLTAAAAGGRAMVHPPVVPR